MNGEQFTYAPSEKNRARPREMGAPAELHSQLDNLD